MTKRNILADQPARTGWPNARCVRCQGGWRGSAYRRRRRRWRWRRRGHPDPLPWLAHSVTLKDVPAVGIDEFPLDGGSLGWRIARCRRRRSIRRWRGVYRRSGIGGRRGIGCRRRIGHGRGIRRRSGQGPEWGRHDGRDTKRHATDDSPGHPPSAVTSMGPAVPVSSGQRSALKGPKQHGSHQGYYEEFAHGTPSLQDYAHSPYFSPTPLLL